MSWKNKKYCIVATNQKYLEIWMLMKIYIIMINCVFFLVFEFDLNNDKELLKLINFIIYSI